MIFLRAKHGQKITDDKYGLLVFNQKFIVLEVMSFLYFLRISLRILQLYTRNISVLLVCELWGAVHVGLVGCARVLNILT